jgi:hypothetical protein
MSSSTPARLGPRRRSPQLGVTVFIALPMIVLAMALAIVRQTGMSLDEYVLAFTQYAKTMM